VNRRSLLVAASLFGLVTLFRVARSQAAKVDRVEFPDRLRAGDVTLKLRGAGLVYYRSVVKGLAAGLYVDEDANTSDVLADVAKRVEIEYYWSLKGSTIAAALAGPLADNVPADRLAAIQADVDRVHAALADVKPGDRYALTYLPGVGTWLTHNGKTVATVPGKEFAAAYFSIWFGERPMDAKLKRQLLGD
jgi:Chalcone isomerase-like